MTRSDARALRRARIAGGFTGREIGALAQFNHPHLSNMESGRVRPSPGAGKRWHTALISLLRQRIHACEDALRQLESQ
jgi:transcriptional regulator with XRE-family HTH domain